jgi:LPS-assembly protein
MGRLNKFNAKTITAIAAIGFMLSITQLYSAFGENKIIFQNLLTPLGDTIPAPQTGKEKKPADSTGKDSGKLVNVIDTFKISKDSLEAPVTYSAEDSGVLIIPTKQFILYGKAKTTYKDMVIDAATIDYDHGKQEITAKGSSDTSANSLNKTKFVQGGMEILTDWMKYNMKSQKGITHNTYTKQDELHVHAETMKKFDSNTIFAYRASFTTCNLDTPHFDIKAKKMKIINNKLGVSGPAHLEFEGVPTPLIIPFGLYPLNRGRHSGVLVPTFNSSEDFGLGLEGLGYYKVLNDNVDVTVRTNLYSYGGWNLNINPKYLKRYHYSGNFNLQLQNTKILNRYGTKTLEEFTTNQSFMLNWSHARDSRARPGTSFNASVNFGSTKFNQYILNNPYQNFNNQLGSSIAYSKDWRGKYNLSLNANHNQNNVTHLVNMSLPNASFNVVTMYPFEKKEKVGDSKWYEKLGIGYSGNLQNNLSFYDTAFNASRLLDTLQWGADHNIPISLSLPSLGPITISPSVSFQQRWFGQQIIRTWDETNDTVLTNIKRGFFTQSQMSFGISANTRIFGTYLFKKGNLKAIRHEIRPSFGLSYKPDFVAKDYYSVQVDTAKHRIEFSKYDGGLYGAFTKGNFGGISFGVDNLLEMKVRDKKDTAENATKKVKLIDGFGFSSSYNLMADSFALGSFSLYLRSTLFEKINITASANLDPYEVDEFGTRKNVLTYKRGSLGRITNGSLAISTNFQSKSKDGKDETDKQKVAAVNDPYMTPDEQLRQLQYARENPAEFTDFNIPWRIDLSYSLSFNRILKVDYSGYETKLYSNINFNGDFSLSPKWKAGGTGYYNVNTLKLEQFSMFITREMHCWQLSINVTPIGLYRSFSFNISPKSGILRDLKINRSRTFSNL